MINRTLREYINIVVEAHGTNPNHALIGGVSFTAIRQQNARGQKFWRAKVDATGEVIEQENQSRAEMWDRLERDASSMGERFAASLMRH